jgi:enediyne biosynthesis protein E4
MTKPYRKAAKFGSLFLFLFQGWCIFVNNNLSQLTMKYIGFKISIVVPMMLLFACGARQEDTLFTVVPASRSGLVFNNQLSENDSINILDNEFVYNGAGVAVADVNNDGLDDIFLTGNQVENKLFLNKGNLKFQDISLAAGIKKPDSLMWSSGVTIIDINADGLKDIYICNTFRKDSLLRKNLLYINNGLNSKGIPTFSEEAQKYGVAHTSYSSHAQFFDYDLDGDLDLFIGVNRIEGINPNQFSPLTDDGTSLSKDVLYENMHQDSLEQIHFVERSETAGIRYHGYSHSTLIYDFNKDGLPDIYVANDFLSNDLVYINNGDGTFTNKAGEIFKHFSLSSMGSDLADVNKDGLMDIFTTEMQPYYNKRKKLFQGPSSYQKEIFTRKYQYAHQYTRNTLQLNLGTNPTNQLPIFGDIGMLAGIQETDWSWAPLFADFNNNGWPDLLITNGFPKDVTDRDFGDFRITASKILTKENLIAAIPEIKIPNFIFENNEGQGFTDVTQEWGLDFGTFSNGAAYADLDNDGDLDLIINNINDNVLLLENRQRQQNPKDHYLRVQLKGTQKNEAAFGATVVLYCKGEQQKKMVLSGRGYLSQPESTLHFGLGKHVLVDSLLVQWPNGERQQLGALEPNQTITIAHTPNKPKLTTPLAHAGMFQQVASEHGLDHESLDMDFIDFNFQRTLPHKFSQYGPSVAVGDVNNDGLEDLFLGASRSYDQMWFLQRPDGTFDQRPVAYKNGDKLEEDTGILLFDADNDGDLDLYIGRGSAQYPTGHAYYKDQLWLNDGKGNYTDASHAIPDGNTNTSVVKAADFDGDGDLDLFVGSRVLPFAYPKSDRAYIFENRTENGEVVFVDVTQNVNPDLKFPGMVSDALWTDFNNDFQPDLILAMEWSALRFYENQKGKLVDVTEKTGLQDQLGWWNSLAAADLDNDGDLDYIAGNFGRNINFQGSKEHPVRLYAKDLDDNGTIDPLISYYLRDSIGVKKEYLYHPWQDVTKQYVGIRKKFNSFGAFGESTLPEMFADGLLDDATVLTFNYMESSWIENLGNGSFKMHPLPLAAQYAPIYGILPQDMDHDGLVDIFLVGNDFGMEVQQGMADALVGVVLKNMGNGSFSALPLDKSHFFVPGDAKGLVSINVQNNQNLILATQNNGPLKVFAAIPDPLVRFATFAPHEINAKVTFANHTERVVEAYWGSSFNSQSSRSFKVTPTMQTITFYDRFGKVSRSVSVSPTADL